jgi:branched-chain amino acid transport system permease protein
VIVQQVVNGLASGALYALLAAGITVIYGLTQVVNFAQGEFMMLGGYLTLTVVDAHGGYAVAVIVAVVVLALAGVLSERSVFNGAEKRPLTGFIVSLGLVAVLQAIAVEVWSDNTRSIATPILGIVHMGSVIIARQRLVVLAIGLVVLLALIAHLKLTRSGRALRSVAGDRMMSGMLGINTRAVVTRAFVIGTATAGLAGALLASVSPLTPYIGGNFVFKGFAVALIGGLGNVVGAVSVGFALGVVEAVLTSYVSGAWQDAYVFIIMILFLLVRPTGLLRGTAGARL